MISRLTWNPQCSICANIWKKKGKKKPHRGGTSPYPGGVMRLVAQL